MPPYHKVLRILALIIFPTQFKAMLKKQQQAIDRYDSARNNKFAYFRQKELQSKTAKHKNSSIHNNIKAIIKPPPSEIQSQPQLIKSRKRASLIRTSSKSNQAGSLGKFRKEFLSDSYNHQDYLQANKRRALTKEVIQIKTQADTCFEDLGVEQLHNQMVVLHQNVKKMKHEK